MQTQDEVVKLLLGKNDFSEGKIKHAVDWFFQSLGMPVQYFANHSSEDISQHIQSLMAAKVLAESSSHPFDINLHQEKEDSAMFATRSFISTDSGKATRVGESISAVLVLERQIEQKYLSGSSTSVDESADPRRDVPSVSLSFQPIAKRSQVFRLAAFRSSGVLDEKNKNHLRLYLLRAPKYANPSPAETETDIAQLGDAEFLAKTDPALLDVYKRVLAASVGTLGPVIEVLPDFVKENDGLSSSVVMVAHRIGTTHSYFTGIPDVYRCHGMYATQKFVEPFSNNVVIFTFLLRTVGGADASIDLPTRLAAIAKDASLHFVLPRNSLSPLLSKGVLSAHEVAYTYACWKFAFHFLSRANDEFSEVATALRTANSSSALSVLGRLRMALKTHAFVEGSILDSIFGNTALAKWLYNDFSLRHSPDHYKSGSALPSKEEGLAYIRRNCTTDADVAIFSSFFLFNRAVLKTNLYRPHKTALSFRLDPSFLPPGDYPDKPYGVFFIVGSEFRGFHVRFQDIARGGVRLVRSQFSQDFASNVASVFDECYGLANTQQRKNKDIPEGGSKGIVLLNLAHQDKGRVAFQKFVDGLLDLLLPCDRVVDHLGRREIIFLGPDEGTADFMDWASLHAKSRGYEYWKAFTTGKNQAFGGIPHDTYGMTTHGVRAFVTGIQRKLAIEPSEAFKVQTGGPDGDLGSNEIKQGLEKTVAVVDGSGVLCDPRGLDATELKRLAGLRKPVENFDTSKLSPEGFLVLVSQKDIKLPDGTVVENGTAFRNNFHLNKFAHGDFFVPCGGRPAAVNGENVKHFLYRPDSGDKRELRYKYIVEGANLFFTQDARLALEAAGVVLFKDASANKGGVTSSSLEVLAALSMTDSEFSTHMQVKDLANPPAFYAAYVVEVQSIIHRNADLEFECMWAESQRTGEPRSIISDKLSLRITSLSVVIEQSETLWTNMALRNKVLRNAIPKTLADTIGFEKVVQQVPENYLRALFASHIASRFVYAAGLQQSDFAFYEFVEQYV